YPKLIPKAPVDRPRFEPATNKKSPTTVELFCRGGRIRTYDLHIPNVARYRATLHPEGITFFFLWHKYTAYFVTVKTFLTLFSNPLINCTIISYIIFISPGTLHVMLSTPKHT